MPTKGCDCPTCRAEKTLRPIMPEIAFSASCGDHLVLAMSPAGEWLVDWPRVERFAASADVDPTLLAICKLLQVARDRTGLVEPTSMALALALPGASGQPN